MVFDSKIKKQIERLESERIKMLDKISFLEKEVKARPSDYEREARQASKKASEFRNRAEDTNKSSSQLFAGIQAIQKNIVDINSEINRSLTEVQNHNTLITNYHSDSENKYNLLLEKVNSVNTLFEGQSDLESKIERLATIFSNSDDKSSKLEAIYNSCLSKKKEIDAISYEINGYTDEDEETGETTEVKGLKHSLESTYENLSTNIGESEKSISALGVKAESDFVEFEEKWDNNLAEIKNEINKLLPKALTAGLSHAFSNKKTAEKWSSFFMSIQFYVSILGMLAVSVIPFYVGFISLQEGKSLEQVLLDMPRLVLSIIPLYIPVFWVAYSASKKINLSKRLVEEYTHKEVLSKTFEGLSKQIEEIENPNISSELRTKLLFNMLEVSAENPGKLISDYNKADHPLMDALDKSTQLTNAVNRLSNIPGLFRISEILDKKSKRILEEEARKAEEALDAIASEEDS